jgi:hypothetical protein
MEKRGEDLAKALLITGFNNWGKTTLINNLFQKKRFTSGLLHVIPGINRSFVVVPQSNDDDGEIGFLKKVKERNNNNQHYRQDLLAAFCPTREKINDSRRILLNPLFTSFEEIYLFYLEYKWDYHAKLQIEELINYYKGIPNLNHIVINADYGKIGMNNDNTRLLDKVAQIKSEIVKIP